MAGLFCNISYKGQDDPGIGPSSTQTDATGSHSVYRSQIRHALHFVLITDDTHLLASSKEAFDQGQSTCAVATFQLVWGWHAVFAWLKHAAGQVSSPAQLVYAGQSQDL